ncbi:DNA-binding XRE family transcriptional regulator [Streptosporangium becharense]|uniref:DNA-binding XRE family transcriptional regulator n=1 Tax=Streptosporangium becharense TaxID=1816182 RepID=A0A7W9IHN4_9ACTN|nr:helix-turn-helix transcriptional regulator [Streptosporangium becharense]MBB2914891.1 DNA-binding XRE family transcriptional regulator [Streptosporangium becharense]MBB5820298.1 DNA-binding XRE family transcriptional regulator [Streptosporangium becharense]
MTDEPTSYTELAEVLTALPLLLREARRARHLNQSKAAGQLGVSVATISRIESGEGCYVESALTVLRWLDMGGDERG